MFKYKKNTYVDKTFAPDYKTAKEIFDIAEKYGTKFFSSSALRYSEELNDLISSNAVITLGGGGNMPEYIIHQIEMAVKVIEEKAIAVRVENQSEQYVCTIAFENNKKATMIFAPNLGFAVCTDTEHRVVASPFFKNLLTDILRFYKTGEVSFDTKQTLEVMKIREAVIKGQEKLGEWIEL